MSVYDYIIVGSGIAGLYTALLAREHGSVLVLTKGSLDECNTRYAQGGIAAAIGEGDSPDLHMDDTLKAGGDLCDPEAVRVLTEEAPDRIADLIKLGVAFDTLNGEINLAREGAHSVPRILHAGGDATGERIETTLGVRLRESRISFLENSLLTNILVDEGGARGVEYLEVGSRTRHQIGCTYLILATGGAGQLFRYTTNPSVATGDGVAMAYLAGAEIMDMEFFQFHPTALKLPGAPPFLISEAVRGEGGILKNSLGHAFMKDYSPQADLAPRDVVARATVREMRKASTDHVLLDITHLPSQRVTTRFPQIYRFCLSQGLDITTTPIPVAPAAHYMMGGIRTNSWGETNIKGLFACGEAACTGVHGANRLASNSLLETLVFGKRVVERTMDGSKGVAHYPKDDSLYLRVPDRAALTGQNPPPTLERLQSLMWESVGMERNEQGLMLALGTLAAWQGQLSDHRDRPSAELRNLAITGRLMAEAALLRRESRGAHFRLDYPETLMEWRRNIVITRGE